MAGPAIRAVAHGAARSRATTRSTLGHHEPCDPALAPTLPRRRRVTATSSDGSPGASDVVIVQGDALRRAPALADCGAVARRRPLRPVPPRSSSSRSRHLEPDARRRAIGRGTRRRERAAAARRRVPLREPRSNATSGSASSPASGRVNEHTYDADPRLERLLVEVPFGYGSAASDGGGHALRGVVPGIDVDDEIVLWGGGIYDWFDPIRSSPRSTRCACAVPGFVWSSPARVTRTPTSESPRPRRACATSRPNVGCSTCTCSSVTGFRIDERAGYLLDADIAVSTHFEHVETAFSFRTRVLDYLWAGLPSVSDRGDVLGRRGRTGRRGDHRGPRGSGRDRSRARASARRR